MSDIHKSKVTAHHLGSYCSSRNQQRTEFRIEF